MANTWRPVSCSWPVGIGLLVVAGIATAQPPPPPPPPGTGPTGPAWCTSEACEVSGFELSAGIGYLSPSGKFGGFTGHSVWGTSQDTPMSDMVTAGYDVLIDVGHRVNRTLYYGVHVAYGPSMGTPRDAASAYLSCDHSGCAPTSFKVGGKIVIHPKTRAFGPQVDPYIGFGVNYDQLSFTGDSTVKIYGMEFMYITLGVDYLVSRPLSAGVFVSGSIGMYFGADDADTDTVALHEWFTFGVRGAFRL